VRTSNLRDRFADTKYIIHTEILPEKDVIKDIPTLEEATMGH
jgi:hypothetical protein